MRLIKHKKYTILVSGASGIVGYGILRSLSERNDCFLIGTTIYPESPANCFADLVEIAPKTDAPDYLDWLVSLVEKYSVDMIIPGIEADMKTWNNYRKELEDTGAFVLLNNASLIEVCLDKWFFYNKLKESGYNGRIETSLEHNFTLYSMPFILKPRCGYGARGIVKVDSEEIYKLYVDEIGPRLMMQEFIEGDDEEYTVSVFFDKNSDILAMMGLRRKLAQSGYTEMAEVVSTEIFLEDIIELAKVFKPIGPTNFQFRKCNGKLRLLEINPRISSSTSIRSKFGYNECTMAVEYFIEGKSVTQPEIRRGKAMRYIEDFIIYDSDNI